MLPVPVYFSAQSTPPPENSALSRLLLFLEKAWRQLHPKPSSPPQETPQQREDPPEPDTLERKALSLPESMAHGFDPNALEEGTELPRLLWTAKNGTYEAFEALLATGANPYATSKEGATLTHHAVYNEDPRVLAKVLKLGLNPAQESSFGVYPLMTACYEDNLNAIHQLLQAYLQHNIPLNPLLSEAICLLRPDILKEILQLGADPNSLNKEGERPLTVVFSLKTHNYILTTFSRQVEMSRILLAAGADPTIISFELQMILPLEDKDPKKLLSTFLAHRPHVNAATMEKFYATADNTGSSYEWKPLLPELLTIADHLAPDVLKNEWVINNISSAVTRPYRYIYSNDTSHPEQGHIQKLERIVLENWMRVGTMGLSFSRWRFDAMQPWKGIGPMAQNSLLESSGLFTPSPPRGDDATYHRSFQYTDPATGLCIELRRAYITLSQPELGTLVVRNSSHHYGRDLLPELAYYSPEQVYTGGEDLVNPKDLLEKNGFHGLLDKALHLTPELQSETHQKVGALRTGFEDVMSRYTDWKCGFKDGTPPPGFGPLLSLALKSAEHQGQNTPFGKQKNLRLAWVHPSELPVIRYALEMSNPDIQAEVRAYLTQPQNHAQYPQLLAFLESGLKQGWELILAPPTEA
jgi:ankyrin repeat protein